MFFYVLNVFLFLNNFFTGSACGVSINDCDPNPCKNNGTCTDLIGGYNCTCTSGFTGIYVMILK